MLPSKKIISKEFSLLTSIGDSYRCTIYVHVGINILGSGGKSPTGQPPRRSAFPEAQAGPYPTSRLPFYASLIHTT